MNNDQLLRINGGGKRENRKRITNMGRKYSRDNSRDTCKVILDGKQYRISDESPSDKK